MKFLAVTILLAAASLSEGQSTTTKAGGTGANNSIPGLSEVEEKVKSAMEKVMEVSLDNANSEFQVVKFRIHEFRSSPAFFTLRRGFHPELGDGPDSRKEKAVD